MNQGPHPEVTDMTAKPIPDGFHTVTPHLTVEGGEQAIAFGELGD